MILNTQIHGEPTDTPALLIVHGLFGSGRNWRAIAKHLSPHRQVITVDLRNHGDSFWHDSHTYADMASDLAHVIEQHGAPMDVLGHSMGGKAAMILAFENPNMINRLLIADIAPIGYTHSQISLVDLMRALPIDNIQRRSQADEILARDITAPAVRQFLLQSLKIETDGNSWALNLSALASNMDDIIGFPTTNETFDGPTWFIRGGASDYIKDEHSTVIETHFPSSATYTIDGAGHWVHAEAPRRFLELVKDILDHN